MTAPEDYWRCESCVWARMATVVLVDPHQTSAEQRAIPALFCHVERPRVRVDPDAYCPDWRGRSQP